MRKLPKRSGFPFRFPGQHNATPKSERFRDKRLIEPKALNDFVADRDVERYDRPAPGKSRSIIFNRSANRLNFVLDEVVDAPFERNFQIVARKKEEQVERSKDAETPQNLGPPRSDALHERDRRSQRVAVERRSVSGNISRAQIRTVETTFPTPGAVKFVKLGHLFPLTSLDFSKKTLGTQY